MATKKKHTKQQEIAITPKKPIKREKNPHDKKRLTKRKLRDWMYGYIFLAPWIVGVVLFFVMSMVDSLNYSVHKIVMDNGVQMTALEHWYDNYASVFALETDLPTTLGSFAISLVLQVPIIIAFSLIIAMLLGLAVNLSGLGLPQSVCPLPADAVQMGRHGQQVLHLRALHCKGKPDGNRPNQRKPRNFRHGLLFFAEKLRIDDGFKPQKMVLRGKDLKVKPVLAQYSPEFLRYG